MVSLLLLLLLLAATTTATINDYSCRSTTHPNPVILLHGLGGSHNDDLNILQSWLQSQDYCTFSLTYGAHPTLPEVGGLTAIADSAREIAQFIRSVHAATHARSVDLIGHSEGAFQALYVAKFEGVAPIIDKIVPIAPPTHGTSFAGLYHLAYLLGNVSRHLVADLLHTLGCPACDDLGPDGAAVNRLTGDGTPIRQPGNSVTIITSRFDELVTPTHTSFVHEDGVRNLYVQDRCPLDTVGHLGEVYDWNVWQLVRNALDGTPERGFDCLVGSPGR